MDHEGYAAWEEHMISTLAGEDAQRLQAAPEQSLSALAQHARTLTRWRPGATTIADEVRNLRSEFTAGRVGPDWIEDGRLFNMARDSLPATQHWPDIPRDAEIVWRESVSDVWAEYQPAISRFLAAHAFAAWMAYQGRGLPSLIRRLCTALAVLRVEAVRVGTVDPPFTRSSLKHSIRQTDLLLVHLVDRDELAARLSTA